MSILLGALEADLVDGEREVLASGILGDYPEHRRTPSRWRSAGIAFVKREGTPRPSPNPESTTSVHSSIFGDQVVAAAMGDRLVHHAEVISLRGDSYRLKCKGKEVLQPEAAREASSFQPAVLSGGECNDGRS